MLLETPVALSSSHCLVCFISKSHCAVYAVSVLCHVDSNKQWVLLKLADTGFFLSFLPQACKQVQVLCWLLFSEHRAVASYHAALLPPSPALWLFLCLFFFFYLLCHLSQVEYKHITNAPIQNRLALFCANSKTLYPLYSHRYTFIA